MDRIPVVIDTDPGSDDAIAMMMVHGSGLFDIRAVCPVCGNVPLRETLDNALKLCTYFGIRTRVCPGAEGPLYRGTVLNSNFAARARELGMEGEEAEFNYGDSMFDMQFPEPDIVPERTRAWDAIYEEAVKAGGELRLLVIGPHTDVAIALQKYEGLHSLIKEIVFMGGALRKGNHTPNAEFNVLADPFAFASVLKWGIPMRMVGLEVIDRSWLTVDEVEEMARLGTSVSSMLWADWKAVREAMSIPDYPEWHRGRTILHDSVAAAWLIDPDICSWQDMRISVETASPVSLGRTVADLRPDAGAPNVRVATDLDREAYAALVRRCVLGYPKEAER